MYNYVLYIIILQNFGGYDDDFLDLIIHDTKQ